jgi:hypothetical protein
MSSINVMTPYRQGTGASAVTEDDLAGLPAPVQRYLRYSDVIGKPWVSTVRLKYTGKFRMAPDRPWMGVDVTQFYTTNPPGFLWKARFSMAGVPFMWATDTYKNGQSHMLGRLAGLFTVVDGRGEEINQGTMVRYLQEMAWFPAAYLGDNITWQAVDDHAADVTLHDSGRSVTGRMYFDDLGRMLNFAAERYGEFNGKSMMKTWTTPMTEYAEINGMNLPVAGRGVWLLPPADFAYIQVRVQEIVYNQPIPAWQAAHTPRRRR